MNRNGKDKKLRYATRHNNVFDNSLIKRIDLVKKWIVQEIPCFFHCTQNWKCKKLPEYQNILRQLSDILEYKIKKKPQEAIKEVWKLSSKAIIMRSKIKSCIYVQKRLSRLGYNRWREYYPDEIQSFIKEVLGHEIIKLLQFYKGTPKYSKGLWKSQTKPKTNTTIDNQSFRKLF